MTTTTTSGAADLRATFSEMLVDLPNTEPFTLFKAGFDAALAAGQATAAQQSGAKLNYSVLYVYANQHGIDYNSLCVAVREATAQPCEPTPAELACRMKWPAAEMDTVGSAMLTQAKSTGDAELRSAGWDLHDAAGALLAEIKVKT